jgi:hypothetical protein
MLRKLVISWGAQNPRPEMSAPYPQMSAPSTHIFACFFELYEQVGYS